MRKQKRETESLSLEVVGGTPPVFTYILNVTRSSCVNCMCIHTSTQTHRHMDNTIFLSIHYTLRCTVLLSPLQYSNLPYSTPLSSSPLPYSTPLSSSPLPYSTPLSSSPLPYSTPLSSTALYFPLQPCTIVYALPLTNCNCKPAYGLKVSSSRRTLLQLGTCNTS